MSILVTASPFSFFFFFFLFYFFFFFTSHVSAPFVFFCFNCVMLTYRNKTGDKKTQYVEEHVTKHRALISARQNEFSRGAWNSQPASAISVFRITARLTYKAWASERLEWAARHFVCQSVILFIEATYTLLYIAWGEWRMKLLGYGYTSHLLGESKDSWRVWPAALSLHPRETFSV